MCIGVPMQVVEAHATFAWCEIDGRRQQVDTLLVGEQSTGTWLLVFLDSAREVLTPQQAEQIADALRAVQLAMQGETELGHLFADLIAREPQLPEFLQG